MDAKETIKYLYQHGHKPKTIHFCTITNEINDLIALSETAGKKQHEIWDALKEQTKELARAYDKIESLKKKLDEAEKKKIEKGLANVALVRKIKEAEAEIGMLKMGFKPNKCNTKGCDEVISTSYCTKCRRDWES